MTLTRRGFIKLMGGLMGSWFFSLPEFHDVGVMSRFLSDSFDPAVEESRILAKYGVLNTKTRENFTFDESKYAPRRAEIERSNWKANNRHMPIAIPPEVRNQPGNRSPEALEEVVAYTGFNHPRYVAQPGERASMCNIAAWDWSRGLQVHLPHWMGETEMSANMLFRWISEPTAGGIYGEGWQPVNATAGQLLANRGVPVFALAENPSPGRHGHVALVYPLEAEQRPAMGVVSPIFATVKSGRGRRRNGIMDLASTFRWLNPTYFVHKLDFVVHHIP